MLLLVNNVHEKTLQKVKTDKILKMSVHCLYFAFLLQLCNCVTWECTHFSANLMRTFFMYIINYTQIDIFLYSHHLSG